MDGVDFLDGSFVLCTPQVAPIAWTGGTPLYVSGPGGVYYCEYGMAFYSVEPHFVGLMIVDALVYRHDWVQQSGTLESDLIFGPLFNYDHNIDLSGGAGLSFAHIKNIP